MNVLNFQQQPLHDIPEICHTPYDFFKLFVDDQFVDKTIIIIHQTVLSLSWYIKREPITFTDISGISGTNFPKSGYGGQDTNSGWFFTSPRRLSIFNSVLVHVISPFVQFAYILIISFDVAACSSLVMKFSPISFLMSSVVIYAFVFW